MAEARRVAVEARDFTDESMHAGRSPRFSTGSLVELGESPDTDNLGSNSSSGFSSASEDEEFRRPSKDSDTGLCSTAKNKNIHKTAQVSSKSIINRKKVEM